MKAGLAWRTNRRPRRIEHSPARNSRKPAGEIGRAGGKACYGPIAEGRRMMAFR